MFTAKIHPPGTNHRGVNLDIGFKVQVVASVRVVSVPESPGVTISTVPARQTPPRAGPRPVPGVRTRGRLSLSVPPNRELEVPVAGPDAELAAAERLRLLDCDSGRTGRRAAPRPALHLGIKIYPKFIPKFSRTLLHPVSSGKWLMFSGMLWIRRTTMFTIFGNHLEKRHPGQASSARVSSQDNWDIQV